MTAVGLGPRPRPRPSPQSRFGLMIGVQTGVSLVVAQTFSPSQHQNRMKATRATASNTTDSSSSSNRNNINKTRPGDLLRWLHLMNAADLIEIEISNRAFLHEEFGDAVTKSRLDSLSSLKLHALCLSLEHIKSIHDMYEPECVSPVGRTIMRNVLIGLLQEHPDCVDLVQVLVLRIQE